MYISLMVTFAPLCSRSAHARKEQENWVRVQTDDLVQLELTAPKLFFMF